MRQQSLQFEPAEVVDPLEFDFGVVRFGRESRVAKSLKPIYPPLSLADIDASLLRKRPNFSIEQVTILEIMDQNPYGMPCLVTDGEYVVHCIFQLRHGGSKDFLEVGHVVDILEARLAKRKDPWDREKTPTDPNFLKVEVLAARSSHIQAHVEVRHPDPKAIQKSPWPIQWVEERETARNILQQVITRDYVGLDTENSSNLNQIVPETLQIADPKELKIYIFDTRKIPLDDFQPILTGPLVKAEHYSSFEAGRLRDEDLFQKNVFDTHLETHILQPHLGNFSLKNCAQFLCGIVLDKKSHSTNWRQRPLEENQILYAALDAWAVMKLMERLRQLRTEAGKNIPTTLSGLHDDLFRCIHALSQDAPLRHLESERAKLEQAIRSRLAQGEPECETEQGAARIMPPPSHVLASLLHDQLSLTKGVLEDTVGDAIAKFEYVFWETVDKALQRLNVPTVYRELLISTVDEDSIMLTTPNIELPFTIPAQSERRIEKRKIPHLLLQLQEVMDRLLSRMHRENRELSLLSARKEILFYEIKKHLSRGEKFQGDHGTVTPWLQRCLVKKASLLSALPHWFEQIPYTSTEQRKEIMRTLRTSPSLISHSDTRLVFQECFPDCSNELRRLLTANSLGYRDSQPRFLIRCEL
jgi:hypothetical protein